MDYNESIYNFIYNQLKNCKYIYHDINAITLKSLAEKHYGFKTSPLNEWELAFEWATANIFGGGCEVEIVLP